MFFDIYVHYLISVKSSSSIFPPSGTLSPLEWAYTPQWVSNFTSEFQLLDDHQGSSPDNGTWLSSTDLSLCKSNFFHVFLSYKCDLHPNEFLPHFWRAEYEISYVQLKKNKSDQVEDSSDKVIFFFLIEEGRVNFPALL